MAKDGRKVAIGVGVLAGIGTLIFAATRAKAAPPLPGLANLYGKVTDTVTGEKIPDVLVTLDGMQDYSDAAGNYIFTNLEPGEYALQFSKDGYETAVF